jgi:hypothetical protein
LFAYRQGRPLVGLVNAPTLAVAMTPAMKPWVELGEALGKVSAAIVHSYGHLPVEVNCVLRGKSVNPTSHKNKIIPKSEVKPQKSKHFSFFFFLSEDCQVQQDVGFIYSWSTSPVGISEILRKMSARMNLTSRHQISRHSHSFHAIFFFFYNCLSKSLVAIYKLHFGY